MSGTKRGSIEHRFHAGSGQQNQRDCFVACVKFMDSHPGFTRIASSYGTGGTGFDYTGGPNAPGENAFAVWKATTSTLHYWVLIQWAFNEQFGQAGNGHPGSLSSSTGQGGYGIGIAVALDTTGTSPWNGGTANAGADAKGSPVWVANGGTLVVLPRSNGAGGTHAANREACHTIDQDSPSDLRLQIVGDDDSLIFATDHTNAGKYDNFVYVGPYTPAAGVSAPKPLCMLGLSFSGSDWQVTTDVGSLDNSTEPSGGGGAVASPADGPRIVRLDRLAQVLTTEQQPNGARGSVNDELPVTIRLRDGQGAGTYGLLGTVPLLGEIANLATHTGNSDLSRVVLGSATVGQVKVTIPWDGATTPGSGNTVAGIQFP